MGWGGVLFFHARSFAFAALTVSNDKTEQSL